MNSIRRFTRSLVAGIHGFFLLFAAVTCATAYNLLKASPFGAAPLALGAATLTPQQILLDVIAGFRKWFPGFGQIGTDLRQGPLKLNMRHTAHIASIPATSTYDATTGYANGATNARSLLTDVGVMVNNHPTVPLKWLHLDQIKDIKQKWDECMSLAGYALAKSCVDAGIFGKLTTRYFSQELVTSIANFDYDVLAEATTALNNKGASPVGRILFVNSAVAQVLSVDARLISKDYAGQLLDGNGYRQWRNVGGFALIQEYPDLAANNGSTLTGVTATATTDVLAKTAHGLVTGDPVVLSAIGGGAAGLSINTRYWAIKVDADSFKLATTYANAVAGTAIDVTSDSSSGHISLALKEALVAFAGDRRAFSFLAGMPDGMDNDFSDSLGIPRNTMFDRVVDPESGMPMAAAKWQVPGTADFHWVPTLVYGTNAGKELDTALAANSATANSVLAAANAAGSGTDYAGLRITTGV